MTAAAISNHEIRAAVRQHGGSVWQNRNRLNALEDLVALPRGYAVKLPAAVVLAAVQQEMRDASRADSPAYLRARSELEQLTPRQKVSCTPLWAARGRHVRLADHTDQVRCDTDAQVCVSVATTGASVSVMVQASLLALSAADVSVVRAGPPQQIPL